MFLILKKNRSHPGFYLISTVKSNIISLFNVLKSRCWELGFRYLGLGNRRKPKTQHPIPKT